MKERLFVLIALIVLRIVIGLVIWTLESKNSKILVTGNIYRVIQTDNNCILEFEGIVAKMTDVCDVYIGQQVSVVGKLNTSLIEVLRGKKAIVNATFDTLDNKKKIVISPERKIDFITKIKNYCTHVYQKYLPEAESALIAGIVLGDKTNIGLNFYQKMIKSGTIHIAVASGFNLMLVGGTVLSLLFWIVERKWATMFTIAAMSFYALLAGLQPPVLRALVMASFIYVAQSIGRKPMSVWLLVVSCWMLIVWDTEMLWSVSFQLSVAASVGLMVLTPFVLEKLSMVRLEKEGKFLEKLGIISTTCTMVLTAPILWFAFGRFSIMGLFSNLFVLPLVPVVMVLGGLMLIAPQIFFVPTYTLLHLIVLIINFFGS